MVLFRKLHKWIALAIGLQVAIWMLSGLAMGLIDHHRVAGIHSTSKSNPLPLSEQSAGLLGPDTILRSLPGGAIVREVQLFTFFERPTYRVRSGNTVSLYSAIDGSLVTIDEPAARTLAVEDYAGDGQVLAVTEMQAPAMEVRHHAGQVWRVDFDDDDDTSVYVSGQDGTILESRNASWRLFDIFFMLHVMDYQGREDFNNILVIFASLIAAWFAITGVVLFFDSFRLNDFLRLIPGGRFLKQTQLVIRAPHGEVVARVNATTGGRLYDELAKGGIVLPSSCGGGGTCGLCTVTLSPATPVTAADKALISEQDRRLGVRLSCQALAVDNLVIGVSEELLAAEQRTIEVDSARLVTPHIREITFNVKGGEFSYPAGSFVHVIIPPHELSFDEHELRDSIAEIWGGAGLLPGQRINIEASRAYSLATAAADNPGQIILNVRFMPPPVDSSDVPAGIGSSYMWNLRPGDRLNILGPLGDFRAQDSGRDMIVIGGGAGMAPLRSIIRQELLYQKSGRQIRFWYGARSKSDLFYDNEFDELQKDFANFSWHAVLSEPAQADNWNGPTGFVHLAVRDTFLQESPNPDQYEFYICGPPLMLAATRDMLIEHGVPESQILFDDFGI